MRITMKVYTDYQGLQYFNTKQKDHSRYVSWYLHMSEFIYKIHYKPQTKIRKPFSLSQCSEKEISAMEDKSFMAGQVMLLEKDQNKNKEESNAI